MQDVDVMRLDGHGLQVLLAVIEERSMTGAALRLGLNQSTVSHSMDKLRTALKDPLFVRVGRNIVPTSHTLALEPRLRAILADLQGLPSSPVFDPSVETGYVSIAANVTELGPELMHLRDRMRHLAPRIKFRILELGSRENIESLLSNGEVDIVITVRALSYPPQLMVRSLFRDTFAVFYDPDRRNPIENVETYCQAEHGTLDFGGSKPSTIEVALQELSLSRTVSLRVPNALNLAHFIKGTRMICTMQKRLGRSVFASLSACPVPFDLPELNFDLVWHRRNDADPRNAWMRKIVIEATRQAQAWLPQD